MKQKENFVTFCNDIVQYCHPMQSDKCHHFGKSNNDRKGSQNAHWPRKISKIVLSKYNEYKSFIMIFK